jgi:virginiamycin B lyase
VICRASNRTRSTGSRLTAILSLIVASALLGGCAHATQTKEPAPPQQTAVRLPSTWPQRLVMADDGSVWITDEYHGVTRLDPDGRAREYTISEDDADAADIVAGADGAAWFAGIETVGRIDRTGKVETWRVDGFGLARAITAVDGEFWFTNEGAPGRIERLSAAGATIGFSVTGGRASFAMTGIAAGPDGALWFTQRGYGRDAPDGIGRMTTDGRYSSWRLPRRRAAPIRITAGADGALWFTQQDAHAIGRITTAGAITEFPLRTGISPYDITAGTDGALWFTADGCIGRITTSGHVNAWPLRNAGRLIGIAAAPDGSFWFADDVKSTVWHFTPPKEASRAATCYPPAVTRETGSTQATLVYRRLDRFNHVDWFTDARVRISRGERELFREVVPRNPQGEPEYGVFGSADDFAVRDVDGDGEPEVMLELNWNGTHCCDWSRIYRYDASRKTYVPGNHFWGDGSAAPKLEDLNRDGRPEFLSQDDRFAYDFEGYAGSLRPIQIWAYDRGVFHDVTRRYLDQIRRDAAKIWRLYLKYRGKSSVRAILPAWAADQYMLARSDVVDQVLEEARTRGYLDIGEPGSADGYIGAVKRLLRRTGYIAG